VPSCCWLIHGQAHAHVRGRVSEWVAACLARSSISAAPRSSAGSASVQASPRRSCKSCLRTLRRHPTNIQRASDWYGRADDAGYLLVATRHDRAPPASPRGQPLPASPPSASSALAHQPRAKKASGTRGALVPGTLSSYPRALPQRTGAASSAPTGAAAPARAANPPLRPLLHVSRSTEIVEKYTKLHVSPFLNSYHVHSTRRTSPGRSNRTSPRPPPFPPLPPDCTSSCSRNDALRFVYVRDDACVVNLARKSFLSRCGACWLPSLPF